MLSPNQTPFHQLPGTVISEPYPLTFSDGEKQIFTLLCTYKLVWSASHRGTVYGRDVIRTREQRKIKAWGNGEMANYRAHLYNPHLYHIVRTQADENLTDRSGLGSLFGAVPSEPVVSAVSPALTLDGLQTGIRFAAGKAESALPITSRSITSFGDG